jgi:hypothetical protein
MRAQRLRWAQSGWWQSHRATRADRAGVCRAIFSERRDDGDWNAAVMRFEALFAAKRVIGSKKRETSRLLGGFPPSADEAQASVRDFEIRPILSTRPPLIFTMLVALTDAQCTKIRAVPDATLTE